MQAHREEHGVEPICTALKNTPAHVAPSTVHARRRGREQSKRAKRDGELIEAIAGLRASSYCAYGSRKTWVALNRGDVTVARCTVERLMRGQGWSGLSKAKGPWIAPGSVESGLCRDGGCQLGVLSVEQVFVLDGWDVAAV